MAWEEDYHMQDPGRLALFDEYLEMSTIEFNFRLVRIVHFRKLNNTISISLSSFAIWICDIVRCRISIGAILCTAQ